MTEERVPYEAPEGLGDAGTHLWASVTGWLELDADELARLEEVLATATLVATGSTGQPRAHPLLAEVRAHREALRRLLDSLRLPAVGGTAGSDWGKWAAGRRWRGAK